MKFEFAPRPLRRFCACRIRCARRANNTTPTLRALFIVLTTVLTLFVLDTPAGYAQSSANWTWQNPLPQGNNLNNVATTGTLMVAVGDRGTIIRSGNGGVTWRNQVSGISQPLFGVAGVGNTFVAVGASGQILRSPDGGSTWSSQPSGSGQHFRAVVGSGNTFVTVGSSGTLLRSTDGGANWTNQPSGTSQSLFGVAVANGAFLAVGDGGTIIRSADDGTTWNAQSSGVSHSFISVAGNGSTFVAVGYGGAIVRSTDGGINWSSQTSGTTSTLYGVAAYSGGFVAVGSNGLLLHSADDGETWTNQTGGTDQQLYNAAGAGNIIVAVGNYGTILRSTDGGITWTSNGDTGQHIRDVAGSGQTLVAVGTNGYLLHSTDDGVTWTSGSSGTDQTLDAVAAADNTFVAVGWNGTILRSTDGGITWASQTSGTTRSLYGVVGDGATWIAVGFGGTILRSTDGGITWSSQTSGTTGLLDDVTGTTGTFVAVGSLGTLLRSNDGGVTWTNQTSGTSQTLRGVAGDGTTFVAVGEVATVIRSTDGGVTWNSSNSNTSQSLWGIGGNGSNFVAVGNNGTLLYSADGGITWVNHTSGTNNVLTNATGGGNTWVVVGNNSTILRNSSSPTLQITGANLDATAGKINVPVNFTSNGNSIPALGFSIDYEENCLMLDTADVNNDGIPDAVIGLPNGYVHGVQHNATDADGELDISIIDQSQPLTALNDGTLLTIEFTVRPACITTDGATVAVAVNFSDEPAASFGDTNGNAVSGAATGGTFTLTFAAPPTAILLDNNTIPENAAPGTAVGTLRATDPNGGDAHTFALIPGTGATDNSRFAITGDNTLVAQSPFNYEAKASYTIRVIVTDTAGLTFQQPLTVAVTDINDAPRAVDDNAVTDEDVPVTINTVLANDSDQDDDGLTISAVGPGSGPLNGSVSTDGSVVTYTPALGFSGTTAFVYTLSDGTLTDQGTIIVRVRAVDPVEPPPETAVETVEPEVEATLTFTSSTDSTATTAVVVPSGAVSEVISLVYEEAVAPTPSSQPAGFSLAGRNFTLDAFVDGEQQATFNFNQPVTLTLTYADADVAGIEEATLVLFYYDEATDEWRTDGITKISHDLDTNTVIFTIDHLTEFGLSGQTQPLVRVESVPVAIQNSTVDIPVTLATFGNLYDNAAINVSFDSTCLSITNITNNQGSGSGGWNATTAHVELEGSFTDGVIITLSADILPACPAYEITTIHLTNAAFANNGSTINAVRENDGVYILADDPRGDCNGDGVANAGDFSAIALEIFDGDSNAAWWEIHDTDYAGSPLGCDANASENGADPINAPVSSVNVADIICTVLIFFGDTSCTTGAVQVASDATPAILAVGDVTAHVGETVQVPIALTANGHAVAAAGFTIAYDAEALHFDPTDGDGDGVPDALTLALPAGVQAWVQVAEGQITVALAGLSLPLPTLDDGMLGTVTFTATDGVVVDRDVVVLEEANLGNTEGGVVPVVTENGAVARVHQLFLPMVAR